MVNGAYSRSKTEVKMEEAELQKGYRRGLDAGQSRRKILQMVSTAADGPQVLQEELSCSIMQGTDKR